MRSFVGVLVALVAGAVVGLAGTLAAGAVLNQDAAAAQSEVAPVTYGQR
jgi:hypothetical protein